MNWKEQIGSSQEEPWILCLAVWVYTVSIQRSLKVFEQGYNTVSVLE